MFAVATFIVATLLAVVHGVRIDTETAYASRCALAALQDFEAGYVPMFTDGPLARRQTKCQNGMMERSVHSERDHFTVVYEFRQLFPGEVTYGEYTYLHWATVDLSKWKLDTKMIWEDDMLIARFDPSMVHKELLVGCRRSKEEQKRTYEISGHELAITCHSLPEIVSHAYDHKYVGHVPRDGMLLSSHPRSNLTW
jgi:hypothetical protein